MTFTRWEYAVLGGVVGGLFSSTPQDSMVLLMAWLFVRCAP